MPRIVTAAVSLESEHRPDPLLYPAMILLDHIVQEGSHVPLHLVALDREA